MSHVDGVDDGGGYGVRGRTSRDVGVIGESNSGSGVVGRSGDGVGVVGDSTHGSGDGVRGISDNTGVDGFGLNVAGINGLSNYGHGVIGLSVYGFGMHGTSINGTGVYGRSYSNKGYGVNGYNETGTGVYGQSLTGVGVFGISLRSFGVRGNSLWYDGVVGESSFGNGVTGTSLTGNGLYGKSYGGYAAYLDGNVVIAGSLQKGGGSFKIDHPLDPANKYLSHSFVESPDMKNVYDGLITLDKKGEAEVDLPDWFSALNMDYRYQLTAIGAPGPNLYIVKEISESSADDIDTAGNINMKYNRNNNHSSFKIAGGTSGMKVSWQVTGIRKDPWANAHRIQVEEDKPDKERDRYMYPDLYGQSADNGIGYLLIPQEMKVPLVPKDG